MGVLSLKRCRRTCGLKRIFLLVLCGCIVLYGVSVYNRVPKNKDIRDVKDFRNYTENYCGVRCPYGQASLYFKTGYENKIGPTLCVHDTMLFSEKKKNTGRGMNIAVMDAVTFEVMFTQSYDTYLGDHEFLQDMKIKVKEGQLVAVVSYDEITGSLRDESHQWLKLIGSEYIDSVNFRDAYVLIGQKGLKQGHAIEFIKSRGGNSYAEPIEKMGCFSVPMGPVESVEKMLQHVINHKVVPKGDVLLHCDVKEQCDKGHFPVMVFTGKESSVFPEICVNGNMYMTKTLNNAGRGMNIVVVDKTSVVPKMAVRFDLYEKESTDMEAFLQSLSVGDIVIAVTFDDASRKMSFHAKELLNQLGSSMAQNMKFRDVWYFVGQKGIDGFTKFESISYAGLDSEWPKPLKQSFCVPTKLTGFPYKPDIGVYRNDARRGFCQAHDGYDEFCDPAHIDEPFPKPVGLVDDKLQSNPVYSTPIVLIPGFNNNALVKAIQTTVMQPGVKLINIVVTFDEKFSEQGLLAGLFGVRNISINSSKTYQELVMKSLKEVAELYKNSKYVIVIEEELILASDFLYFMSQTHNLLDKDSTVLAISAFNFNGFEHTSGNRSLLYRVEEFPGLAFMMRMSTVTEQVWRIDPKYCCSKRAWEKWSLYTGNHSVYEEIVVPDVSRAMRLSYEGSGTDEDYLASLFNRKRLINMKGNIDIQELSSLTAQHYASLIIDRLKTSVPIDEGVLKKCVKSEGKEMIKFRGIGGSFYVFFEQKEKSDFTVLKQLCQCFGLPVSSKHPPRNLYKGALRFWYIQNEIMILGSHSEFSKHKPDNTKYFK